MFRTHAAEAIDAALIDAAKSDYWYEFEKCYDTHEAEDEHEDDGIEDGRD
jgi:predicted O-methyltransferase YrrM